MEYEKETRLAYNANKAISYHKQQTEGFGWIRLTTLRMQVCTNNALRMCGLKKNDKILDIPCGTCIMSKMIIKHDAYIVASDISIDMMNLGKNIHKDFKFMNLVQSDIVKTPFKKESFECVIVIALMHRLPKNIREQVYKEVAFVSKEYIIMSYAIDNAFQKFKQWLIKTINPSHKSAPSPLPIRTIKNEIKENGLKIIKKFHIIPFLSSSVVLLLKKN